MSANDRESESNPERFVWEHWVWSCCRSVLLRGSDDEGDFGFLGGDVGGQADPEVVAVVAFGGGVDDGGAVHVGGDDGAGLRGPWL